MFRERRSRLLPRVAALVAIASLSACATPGPTREALAAEATAAATAPPAEFPAAPTILDGFELGSTPLGARAGDRVLLGIRLEKAGTTQVRYLLVELTDTIQRQVV